MSQIIIPRGRNRAEQMTAFAAALKDMDKTIGFKISARGWAYQLEQEGVIDKSQFDMIERVINECKRDGLLPIDFTAEEEARKFVGVEIPDNMSPVAFFGLYMKSAMDAGNTYTPDWWDGEEYYIQMLVEKIDLKSLFGGICREYHIPIATSKGWSSMYQRAEYARRFKEAEDRGLQCVLLYCGDHDPDGLRIGEFIRSNLMDLVNITWDDGVTGYDPESLIIDRFGLNFDFIEENKLSWIDNLITGSGKNLADPNHRNYSQSYVQDYLKNVGERKCEANALVTKPKAGRMLCTNAIKKYLGSGAVKRFQARRNKVVEEIEKFKQATGIDKSVDEALRLIDDGE